MAAHHESTKHPITLSFADLSFWCYDCDSYIIGDVLQPVYKHFERDKFPQGVQDQDVQNLVDQFNKISIEESKEEKKDLSFEKLVENIKEGKYKQILVLTGAGISVSAGIPDY